MKNEVQNIRKCLKEEYTHIFVMSDDKNHLHAIEQAYGGTDSNIIFMQPSKFGLQLEKITGDDKPKETTIGGYRVQVDYHDDSDASKRSLTDIIKDAMKHKDKK